MLHYIELYLEDIILNQVIDTDFQIQIQLKKTIEEKELETQEEIEFM